MLITPIIKTQRIKDNGKKNQRNQRKKRKKKSRQKTSRGVDDKDRKISTTA